MKLKHPKAQRGTALLVIMTLLALMSVCIIIASNSLFLLKRDLKLTEQRQLDRHARTTAAK